MFGGTKQVQNTNQTTNSEPWKPAMPALEGLLGQIKGQLPNTGITPNQEAALAGLQGNAQVGNPFMGQITGLANDLLAGGTDRTAMPQNAYNEARAGLLPYTSMSTDPYSNPAFKKVTDDLTSNITDRIKSQYAGAGYSPVTSGDFSQQLGEGIARGVAPTWLQAHNDLEARKLGATSALYGAGNTTAGLLSGMDQTMLGNRGAGVGVTQSALSARDAPYLQQLQIEAQRRGIPIQNLAQLENLIVPMAQLGGTSRSVGQTTQETVVPKGQQALGLGLAAAGLLGAPFTGGMSLGLVGAGTGMLGGGGGGGFGGGGGMFGGMGGGGFNGPGGGFFGIPNSPYSYGAGGYSGMGPFA